MDASLVSTRFRSRTCWIFLTRTIPVNEYPRRAASGVRRTTWRRFSMCYRSETLKVATKRHDISSTMKNLWILSPLRNLRWSFDNSLFDENRPVVRKSVTTYPTTILLSAAIRTNEELATHLLSFVNAHMMNWKSKTKVTRSILVAPDHSIICYLTIDSYSILPSHRKLLESSLSNSKVCKARDAADRKLARRSLLLCVAGKLTSVGNAGLIASFVQIRHNRKDKHVHWPKVTHVQTKQYRPGLTINIAQHIAAFNFGSPSRFRSSKRNNRCGARVRDSASWFLFSLNDNATM